MKNEEKININNYEEGQYEIDDSSYDKESNYVIDKVLGNLIKKTLRNK